MTTKILTPHDWGCYNSEKTVNKINLQNAKDVKHYIQTMLIPILNCAFIENKFLFFKDGSVFKLKVV